MQSLHGKLCVSLYEEFGDACLPIIAKTYAEYGYDLGCGLRNKWKPKDFETIGIHFMDMCNAAGLPTSVQVEGNTAYWEGRKCPFGLENTHREVCEAMMSMDLEMMRALTGVEKGQLTMSIEQSIADGDPICKGTYILLKE
jgi:hypothetical protein